MGKGSEYLTPSEIAEKYPELEDKIGWGAKELGVFLKANLLEGHYNHSTRKSMIKEESIFRLVRFANEKIENQKVEI